MAREADVSRIPERAGGLAVAGFVIGLAGGVLGLGPALLYPLPTAAGAAARALDTRMGAP